MNFSKKTFVAALACLTLSLTACGDNEEPQQGDKPQTVTTENTKELCSDTIDNDGNGKVDCDDSGCAEFAFCQAPEEGKENTLAACQDQEDNDGDGKTDCDDSECQAFSLCQKAEEGKENTLIACQDGEDNDGDGKKDCEDPDCQAFSACAKNDKSGENTVETCIDGEDNDKDGKIDCADEGCRIFAFCVGYTDPTKEEEKTENNAADCQDGKDNDGNGLVDCSDPGCQEFAFCADEIGVAESSRELCTDGRDNDFNGKADCEDENCALWCKDSGAKGENTYEKCSDGIDNDGDGMADCLDTECQIFDVCFGGGPNDGCPNDHFKVSDDDGCGCNNIKIGGECYTNITNATELAAKLKGSAGNFIIKQPIELPVNFTPITGFTGILDGGNHRISGKVDQTGTACGVFGKISSDKAVLRNIDLAITLNCTVPTSTAYNASGTNHSYYVGALASQMSGSASNITSSSKLYVKRAQPSSSVYIDKDSSTPNNVNQMIGGLFGEVNKITDVVVNGNVSIDSDEYFTTHTTSSKVYRHAGGVAGQVVTASNVRGHNYLTVKFYHSSSNSFYPYDYIGGLFGYCKKGAISNVSNSGVIMDRSEDYVGYSFIGGVLGYSENSPVKHSSFSGTINNSYYTRYISYGSYFGGLAGKADNITTSDADVVLKTSLSSGKVYIGGLAGKAITVDSCRVKADIISSNNSGGLVGYHDAVQNDSNAYITPGYIINSSADVVINQQYNTSAHGGIAYSFPNITNLLINNSVRINNVTAGNYSESGAKLMGFSYEYPLIVNNFVYGTDNAAYGWNPPVTKGKYLYESYWNDIFTAPEEATYIDATAQAYTVNANGEPVVEGNMSVLSLLRYNSGHDGGVLSANIPAASGDLVYSDWTYITHEDGTKIPVPVYSLDAGYVPPVQE